MKSMIATAVQLLFTFTLFVLGAVIMGLALAPGLALCYHTWMYPPPSFPLHMTLMGIGIAAAYFIYGLCLIVLVGIFRFIFGLNLKEGEHRIVSWGTLRWAFINSLYLVVANTFLDFILLTPLTNLFYRLMGAKLGKNVQINSKFCADVSLMEIGDDSVIGGHATVICHSFERGRLILKKVKIGKKAIIGLNSVILPGCEIGDGSLIAAGSVLGKNTIVPPHSVYAGVPAESAKNRHGVVDALENP